MKINPFDKLRVNPSIFKVYDIRGVYPGEINEEVARLLGRVLARFFRRVRKVAPRPSLRLKLRRARQARGLTSVVGYDVRLSSKSLESALVNGLREAGVDVVWLGMVPTPVVSFAVLQLKADFGVVVSASHSPGEVNGFKIIDAWANQIGWQKGLERIAGLIAKSKNQKSKRGRHGTVNPINIIPRYAAFLIKRFHGKIRPMRILADYGNGVGATTAEKIFKNLEIKTKALFPRPDGRFPNHNPNPHDPRNFKWIQSELKRGDYDLGIFFDGDADRAVFFDHRGNFIRPDIIAGIFALDILKRHRGAEIYHDLRFSKAVIEEIKKAGGKAIKMPVGNPYYKGKIPERKSAWLGAELSGHIMFRDFWGIDDGFYSALKLMAIMSKAKKPLAVLALPFRRYAQSGEISIAVKNPSRALRKIATRFLGGKRSRLDGLTIEYPEWWFNIRPSHTEPVLRLNVEARDPKNLRQAVRRLSKLLRRP